MDVRPVFSKASLCAALTAAVIGLGLFASGPALADDDGWHRGWRHHYHPGYGYYRPYYYRPYYVYPYAPPPVVYYPPVIYEPPPVVYSAPAPVYASPSLNLIFPIHVR